MAQSSIPIVAKSVFVRRIFRTFPGNILTDTAQAETQPGRVKLRWMVVESSQLAVAFSSEVYSGSREEDAPKHGIRASILIQSEPRLWNERVPYFGRLGNNEAI
jgi:hypothetical protein